MPEPVEGTNLQNDPGQAPGGDQAPAGQTPTQPTQPTQPVVPEGDVAIATALKAAGVQNLQQLNQLLGYADLGIETVKQHHAKQQQVKVQDADLQGRALFKEKFQDRVKPEQLDTLFDILQAEREEVRRIAREESEGTWNAGMDKITKEQQKEVDGYNRFFSDPANVDISKKGSAERAEVERLVSEENYKPQDAAKIVRKELELKAKYKVQAPSGSQAHYEGNQNTPSGDGDDGDRDLAERRKQLEEARKLPRGSRGSDGLIGLNKKWG